MFGILSVKGDRVPQDLVAKMVELGASQEDGAYILDQCADDVLNIQLPGYSVSVSDIKDPKLPLDQVFSGLNLVSMTENQESLVADVRATLAHLGPHIQQINNSFSKVVTSESGVVLAPADFLSAIRMMFDMFEDDSVFASKSVGTIKAWSDAGVGYEAGRYYKAKERPFIDMPTVELGDKSGITNQQIDLFSTIRNVDDRGYERFVYGVVLEPNDGIDYPADPDTHGNIYSAQEVRNACHHYAEFGRERGYMHGPDNPHFSGGYFVGEGNDLVVVENCIMPIELPPLSLGPKQTELIRAGSWCQGMRINCNELWDKVLCGELTGFSVGMLAFKEKLER